MATSELVDDLVRRLRLAGYVISRERRSVLQAFADAGRPLDTEALWAAGERNRCALSRSTASRLLGLLAKLELAQVAGVRSGRRYYELQSGNRTLTLVSASEPGLRQIESEAVVKALEDVVRSAGYRLSHGVAVQVEPLSAEN